MVLHNFKNQNSKLVIDTVRENVIYNDIIFPITNTHVYSQDLGKIETEEYIIKWSKKKMYLYDKMWSITLLEIMDQIENQNLEQGRQEDDDKITIEEKPEQVHAVVTKYIINRNWFISLEKLDTKYFVRSQKRSNETLPFEIEIYPVTGTMGRGVDLEYQTPNGTLTVCKKKNSKWNGIPMGIDHS